MRRDRRAYARLLRLYPRPFRDRFGVPMEQAFADLTDDRGGLPVGVFVDTAAGVVRENIVHEFRRLAAQPGLAAAVGIVCVAPFLLLNLVVSQRIEPVFSLIRPGPHTGPFEYPILAAVLLLLPVGAAVALLPARRGPRLSVIPNIVLAVAMLMAFGALVVTLGDEIYRCDVLEIPNCD